MKRDSIVGPDGLYLCERPRITFCVRTRMYVLDTSGNRHTCGPGRFDRSTLAYRHLENAMDAAMGHVAQRAADRYETLSQRPKRRPERLPWGLSD